MQSRWPTRVQKFAAAPADEFQFLPVGVDRQVKLHFHSVDGGRLYFAFDSLHSPFPFPAPLSLFLPFLFITCILQIALRSDVVFYRRSYDHRVSHGIDNLFCLRKYNGEMYFIFDESRVTEIGVYRRTAGGLILK